MFTTLLFVILIYVNVNIKKNLNEDNIKIVIYPSGNYSETYL